MDLSRRILLGTDSAAYAETGNAKLIKSDHFTTMPSSDIDEIKTRLNIVDVIGEYVRLMKAGTSWKAPCPFHQEKTPSFTVSEEKQLWYCFGCSRGGDLFRFVMEMEGISFREALVQLATRAGVTLQTSQRAQQSTQDKQRTREVVELAAKFYEKQLWDGSGRTAVLPYLHDRGVHDDTLKKFRIGFAPDGWRHLLEFLTKKFSAQEIESAGLIINAESNEPAYRTGRQQIVSNAPHYYDRFRNRIMFPIMDHQGQCVGFSARIAPGGDEAQAKYINTPETDLYHKSAALYGINHAKQAIKNEGATLIVEGNVDVLAVHQAGHHNVVAVSGTALTEQHLATLKRYAPAITLFFDSDRAGVAATRKSALLCFAKGMTVSVVALPQGKDAAELAQENTTLLRGAIAGATDAMTYFFDHTLVEHTLSDARSRADALRQILEIIAAFQSTVEQAHWIARAAMVFGVAEQALFEELRAWKKENHRMPPRTVRQENPRHDRLAEPTRREILTRHFIGLMLADGGVWKAMTEDAAAQKLLAQDRFFAFLAMEGKTCAYNASALLSATADEGIQTTLHDFLTAAQQIIAAHEADRDQPMDHATYAREIFAELQSEVRREKRRQITRAIADAEARKDGAAVQQLMAELSAIS